MAFCIPAPLADRLKKAARDGAFDIPKMYEMTSAQRRELFNKYVDDVQVAKEINAGFERAMISNQKNALTKWASKTFNSKAKQSQQYKDVLAKIDELDEAGLLNSKNADNFLQDLVAERLGVTVTAQEAEKIAELSQKIQSTTNKVTEFGTPTMEYWRARKEMDNFLDSVTPNSQLRVATETIGRGTMLLSLKSPLLNIESNTVTGLTEAFNRRLKTRSWAGKNNAYSKRYIKHAIKVYAETGYDITRMTSLLDERKVKGEAKPHSQGTGKVRKVGRFYEDVVFNKMLGTPDVAFSSMHFIDRANITSTKIARKEGLTGRALNKRALEIMKDATRIDPQTKIGQEVRDESIAEAMYATYVNDSTYSDVALGIRRIFNLASGDLRIGDQLMPFVKTPANVIGVGIDYSGILIPPKLAIDISKSVNSIRKGSTVEQAFGENFSNYGNRVIRAGLGLTFAFILSSLFDPEDYIGEWPTSQKEQELLRLKNATTNSIRIGNKWVSLDYFGALASPLVGMMYAKKYGDSLPDAIFQYYTGVIKQSAKIPGFENMYDLFETIRRSDPSKNTIGENITDLTNYLVGYGRSRTIPAFVYDIARGTDPYDREVNKDDWWAGFKKGIPGLRQTLPIKKNVLGEPITNENLISTLLFGARVKTANNSAIVEEMGRLSETQALPAITDVEKTSSRVKELKNQMGDDAFREAKAEYTQRLRDRIEKIMSTGKYQRMNDDERKKWIDEIKGEEVDRMLKKNKYKKPPTDQRSSRDVHNNLILNLATTAKESIIRPALAAEDIDISYEDWQKQKDNPNWIGKLFNAVKSTFNRTPEPTGELLDPTGELYGKPYIIKEYGVGTQVTFANGSSILVESEEELRKYMGQYQKDYKSLTGKDWPANAPNWIAQTGKEQPAPKEPRMMQVTEGSVLGEEVDQKVKNGRAHKGFKEEELKRPPSNVSKIIKEQSVEKGVDESVIASLLMTESGFVNDPNKDGVNYNKDGSIASRDRGIAQINDKAHPDVTDEQAYDINFAIPYATGILASHLKRFDGNYEMAIASYNRGAGGMNRRGIEGDVFDHPDKPGWKINYAKRYLYAVSNGLDDETRKELGLKSPDEYIWEWEE